MQYLKSLVIGMGVVIVIGSAFLGYSIYRKSMDPQWTPVASGRAGEPFGDLELKLPQGCVLGRVTPDGGVAYVTIRPDGARRGQSVGGPCNRVIVVDVVRGRVLGTLKPSP